jgi:RNA polymerase sigma factor (sigma-70 family)
MSPAPDCFPSNLEGLSLHLRLCDQDPTASADICRSYLPPLLAWIAMGFPKADPDLRQSAVHRALISYVIQPHSFDPERGELGSYLRMAARGDMINLLRQERRHHAKRISWRVVEDADFEGNWTGKDEEPEQAAARQEEADQANTILRQVSAGLTEEEKRVLDLMLAGERQTAAYALVLCVGDLSAQEQARAVKRVKDRIKKRLERGREAHE